MGEYKYDVQGVRVRKSVQRTINGQERKLELMVHSKYFVTEKQTTLSDDDISETKTAVNNIYLNGIRIASLNSNGVTKYYHANNVDSVKIVTDETGAAISRTEYLPYGETFTREGDLTFAPKYNGQALDQESDLYFYNARHYDPEIARFVTADTVTDGPMTVKGWNRYMYVGGNPIMYKDPTGHAIKRKWSDMSVEERKSGKWTLVQGFNAHSPDKAAFTFYTNDLKNDVEIPMAKAREAGGVKHIYIRDAHIDSGQWVNDIKVADVTKIHNSLVQTVKDNHASCTSRCSSRLAIDEDKYQLYDANHGLAYDLGLMNGYKISPQGYPVGGGVTDRYVSTIMGGATELLLAPLGALGSLTKVASKGGSVANPRQLLNMMNKRSGVTAEFAKGDSFRYLQNINARGSHTLLDGGKSHILLRSDANRWDAMHEWLHRGLQRRAGTYRQGEDLFIENFLERHKAFLRLD